MPKPEIDEDLCIGCFNCVVDCVNKVFEEEGELGSLPNVVHLDDCNGCNRCVEACPVDAIKIVDIDSKLEDIFFTYLHRAYLYKTGATDAYAKSLRDRFRRELTNQELVYACLLGYFELPLDAKHFRRCWNIVKERYKEKLPEVYEIFDATSQSFDQDKAGADFKRVFGDLLSPTPRSS